LSKITSSDSGRSELTTTDGGRPFRSAEAIDPPATQETDLSNFRRILRLWPIVLAIGAIFGLIALIVCHFIPTVYESDAEVLLQTPGQTSVDSAEEQMALLAGISTGKSSGTDIPTEIEVMTSDSALREVAKRTGISANPDDARKVIDIKPHKTSASIVLLSVTDPSPQRAQAAAQALIDVYNQNMAKESSTSTGRSIIATKAQIAEISKKLNTYETDYANYAREIGSVDPTEEGIQRVDEFYKLRAGQLLAEQSLQAAQASLATYRQVLVTENPTIVPNLTLVPSPLIQADIAKLADLQEQRSKLAGEYTPQDEEMIENQQQIDAVRADIASESRREASIAGAAIGSADSATKSQVAAASSSGYVVSSVTRGTNPARDDAIAKMEAAQAEVVADTEQVKSFNALLSQANSDIANSPAKLRKLADLQNDCEVYQKLYDALSTQLVTMNSQQPADQAYAQVLQQPNLPNHPVQPRPILYMAVSTVFGIVIGSLLLLMLDYLDPKLRDASDLVDISTVPLLLRLPADLKKLAEQDREKLLMRSYQKLASTLTYHGLGSEIRTLVLTSSGSGEGTETVARHLADALIREGGKIILIDLNGIHPKIVTNSVENGSETPQLSPNGHKNGSDLAVLPNSSGSINVTSLLNSAETQNLLEQLKTHADVVIFDAPAVFDGIKTALLTKQADAILFIAKVDSTTREEVRQALSLLLSGPAPVLGVVLNEEH